MAASESGQRQTSWGKVVDGLVLLAILGLALRRLLPSFQGWYHEDDLHNLRWVMEYRDTPWVALTQRHALHDHIRPLTLMTLWAGAFVSNGAYWGQHVLLVALDLLGLAGLGVLASEIADSRRAGLGAMALGMAVPGFGRMVDWNAWMCSAGEIAFGLWGLVFARRALRDARWWVAAAAAMVAAGLYKEPGWILYPLGAVAMAWGDRKIAGKRALLALALVGLGAAGFAWSWNPVNLERMAGVGLPWPLRAIRALGADPLLLVNGWSTWKGALREVPPLGGLASVAGLLLALVPRPADRRGAAIWGGIGLAVLGLCLAAPQATGALLLGAMIVAVLARFDDPPVGLVLALLTLAVMAPFDKTNEVQVALAGYGLVLTLAVEAAALVREPGRPGRAVLLLALGAVGLGMATAWLRPAELGTYTAESAMEARIVSAGALARTLRASDAWLVSGEALPEEEILPLIGLTVRGEAPPRDAVAVGDALAIHPEGDSLGREILGNDLLRGQTVPTLSGRASGLEVSVIPGWYTIGVVAPLDAVSAAVLQAVDACGHTWTAPKSAILTTRFTPLELEDGCGPLRVGWTGAPADSALRPLLAPLAAPRVSLGGPEPVERVLRVGPDAPQAPPPEGGAPP